MKQCLKCYESFPNQGYLTRHLKKCKYNLEHIVYTCQLCNITYNNFNDIKEHSLICDKELQKKKLCQMIQLRAPSYLLTLRHIYKKKLIIKKFL